MKKKRKLLWISVCLLFPSDAAGIEVPNGEQLNAKCSFSRWLFCKHSLTPPDPLRRDQQKPASDQKVSYQKPCHKKEKKAVMVAKDVAAVLVFLLGSFYCSPVYWGCTVSEGNALSGPPCRSGIWSWWLCDSSGWGIAVSAEQVTQSWSMALFRQAHVRRSYGMVPLRCSKAPLPTFTLVNNNSSLFLLSPKSRIATHTYGAGEWPAVPSRCFSLKKWVIRKKEGENTAEWVIVLISTRQFERVKLQELPSAVAPQTTKLFSVDMRSTCWCKQ